MLNGSISKHHFVTLIYSALKFHFKIQVQTTSLTIQHSVQLTILLEIYFAADSSGLIQCETELLNARKTQRRNDVIKFFFSSAGTSLEFKPSTCYTHEQISFSFFLTLVLLFMMARTNLHWQNAVVINTDMVVLRFFLGPFKLKLTR